MIIIYYYDYNDSNDNNNIEMIRRITPPLRRLTPQLVVMLSFF